MKRILAAIVAVLLCAGCFAQSAVGIMNKYKGKKGAECVNVGSMMMGVVKLFASHDDEARNMLKPFRSIHMINLDDCDAVVKREFAADAKRLKTKGYGELMRVNDNGERIVVYTRQEGDRIKECLVVSTGDDSFLVQIKGNATMEDVDRWIKKNAKK
ncbi:MAG: DUF4252 domain-containing protein [Prevotella sp.]|nr:DUF4252 domain-containing protein [Prevotella sp.]